MQIKGEISAKYEIRRACNILPDAAACSSLRRVFVQRFSRVFHVHKKLILASSSRYRKQLLERLRLDFECLAPEVDESPLEGEAAIDYVCRLARLKADTIARDHAQAVVIGSDQCALLDGEILGKPGNFDNALAQLLAARGKTVVFHTAVCVVERASNFCALEEVPFEVKFRRLARSRLEHYLHVEEPYDCAGSFKAEAYGICLFEHLRGDDPSALTGLPLIRLVAMLERAGLSIV